MDQGLEYFKPFCPRLEDGPQIPDGQASNWKRFYFLDGKGFHQMRRAFTTARGEGYRYWMTTSIFTSFPPQADSCCQVCGGASDRYPAKFLLPVLN